MMILLDECVPWPLHRLLTGHTCTTAQKQGRGGIKNGELLRLAAGRFDLFITADQGLRHQQNIEDARLAVLVLSTNMWRRIEAAAGLIREAIAGIRSATLVQLEIP